MARCLKIFVCGSSSLGDGKGLRSIIAEIAQLGERQTEDLKVPGSNPESSYML